MSLFTKNLYSRTLSLVFTFFLLFSSCAGLKISNIALGNGWSNNSVNTVIFRGKAVTTFENIQFTAYYNEKGKMVLAKRKVGTENWEIKETPYSGNVKDAHNSISLAVDSDGYLHISWDQHNEPLRYVKSTAPFGLELTEELPMTGLQEERVTYPEFQNLPDGKLLFLYRSGESGRGNLVINSYDPVTGKWKQIQDNLIDGEEQRSAYWQTAVGPEGSLYLSWVWRETWDVSTNHDMCFAVSHDGGKSWERSNGEKYELPIKAETAEIAWKINQNSSLINQTSMTVSENSEPFITTYWETDGIPQYKVIFRMNGQWEMIDTNFHKEPFHLGGGGTKRIPISRPVIFLKGNMICLLFRDEENDNRITLAKRTVNGNSWSRIDLSEENLGQWEPNIDVELWKKNRKLHVFSQQVIQVDGEGLTDIPPQPVKIIEVKNIPLK
ncbi:BNR repeat-containing protein [Robertkochia solimangrovi]|uniref:BNR repeat-containing protein n=1 Tax=Robertkochia solimangrovi TaxID=2213046 RepID=UPI00117F23E3|nr:BNR repeat-containing protein [Robertkochia solimangrovi]TRZ41598.1 neuraminidase [Robertkochia solimangrovi]